MKQYEIVATKQYKKDYKRLRKAGLETRKLETVIDRLASDEDLLHRYHDHALCGSLKGARECHIAPDWLLIYRRQKECLVLLLLRTGTHADLFGD